MLLFNYTFDSLRDKCAFFRNTVMSGKWEKIIFYTPSFVPFLVIRPPKQVIDRYVKIIPEFDEHFGGDGNNAVFILGIGVLGYAEVIGERFLADVMVFSNVFQIL